MTRFLRTLLLGAILTALLAAPAVAYKVVREALPDGVVGTPYSYTFKTEGGTGPHTFEKQSGGFPPGLSMSSGGSLTGTPTTAGQFSFWIGATDASGSVSQAPYVINITAKLTVTTNSLPPATVGALYSTQLTVSGGRASSWTVSTGSLPSGLALDSAGVISGTPTAAGTSTFTVLASGGGLSDTKSLSLLVVRPLSVSSSAFPPLVVGKPFTAQLNIGGGIGTVAFALTGGALPPGLTLDPADGVIDGTPTRAGSFTALVGVSTSAGLATSSPLRLVVRAQVGFATRALPRAKVGRRYAARIVLRGGISPVTLSSTSTFPPGVSLDAETGVLSGTPRARGVYRLTIMANDAYGGSAVARFTIVVGR